MEKSPTFVEAKKVAPKDMECMILALQCTYGGEPQINFRRLGPAMGIKPEQAEARWNSIKQTYDLFFYKRPKKQAAGTKRKMAANEGHSSRAQPSHKKPNHGYGGKKGEDKEEEEDEKGDDEGGEDEEEEDEKGGEGDQVGDAISVPPPVPADPVTSDESDEDAVSVDSNNAGAAHIPRLEVGYR